MRILLTGDQRRAGSILRNLLEHDPEMCVVGEAVEAQGLLAQVQEIQPNLLLLDWDLPGLQADEMLRHLRDLRGHLNVVAFSEREEMRREALDAGVNAFVEKEELPSRLVSTLRAIGGLSPYL
jgi:DNA-binding NarL/FixJ family response regulator